MLSSYAPGGHATASRGPLACFGAYRVLVIPDARIIHSVNMALGLHRYYNHHRPHVAPGRLAADASSRQRGVQPRSRQTVQPHYVGRTAC